MIEYLPDGAVAVTHPSTNTVYGISDTESIKYIGQTNQQLEERIRQGYPNNPEVEELLRGPHEVTPLADEVSDRHADARERLYIAQYHTMCNADGYNRQTGGKSGYEVIRRDSQPIIGTKVETGEEVFFPSVAWASRATGAQVSHIYKVLRGIRKTAAGYKFRPAEESEDRQ